MTKFLTLLSFVLGLMVAGIALGGGFASAPVQAQEQEEIAAAPCPMTPVALDEGYGVSRTVLRPVCGEAAR